MSDNHEDDSMELEEEMLDQEVIDKIASNLDRFLGDFLNDPDRDNSLELIAVMVSIAAHLAIDAEIDPDYLIEYVHGAYEQMECTCEPETDPSKLN